MWGVPVRSFTDRLCLAKHESALLDAFDQALGNWGSSDRLPGHKLFFYAGLIPRGYGNDGPAHFEKSMGPRMSVLPRSSQTMWTWSG